MNLKNDGFGLLGTVVYGGLTIGSLVGARVYSSSKNIKMILGLSLLF